MSAKDQRNQQINIIREKDQTVNVEERVKALNIYAVIPLRSKVSSTIDQNEVLLKRCVKAIHESSYINKVVVAADDESLLGLADRFQNSMKILRPEELSLPGIRLNKVLQFTLEEIREAGEFPDILVPAEITYPFRPAGIFDEVIKMLVTSDYDTVIAGMAEYRVCWKKTKEGYMSVMETSKPRNERNPLHVGLPSLATAVYSKVIEQGKRYGDKIGIYEVNDSFASIEIRTRSELEKIAKTFYWPI